MVLIDKQEHKLISVFLIIRYISLTTYDVSVTWETIRILVEHRVYEMCDLNL